MNNYSLTGLVLGLLLAVPAAASTKPEFVTTEHHTRGEARNSLFGDINGDGFTDMVSVSNVVNDAARKLYRYLNIFMGTAEGRFPEKPDQVFRLFDEAVVIDLGEVDSHSPGEEVVFAVPDGAVYLAWKDGKLDETPVRLVTETTIFQRADPTLAVSWDFVRDWNGDGVPDILLPGFQKSALWTRKSGTFQRQQYLEIPLRTLWGSHWENDVIINRVSQLAVRGSLDIPDITYGDMTGDGIGDLTSVQFDSLFVFRGMGDGRFEEKPREIRLNVFRLSDFLKYSRLQAVTRVFLADFNKDGLLDAWTTRLKITNLAAMEVGMETSVFLNDGGRFPAKPDNFWVTDGFAETTRLGDFNNDGYPDLVIQYFPFSITQIVRFLALGTLAIRYEYYHFDPKTGRFPEKPTNTDSWSFAFRTKPTNSSFGASFLYWNDFNGDGRPDFMQARGPGEFTIALSTAQKFGAEAHHYKVPCSFFIYSLDLNRDRRDDIVIRYENMPERNNIITILNSVAK